MDRAAAVSAFFARLNRACIDQERQDLAFDPPLKRIARLEAIAPTFMAMARDALKQRIAADKAAQLARVTRMLEEDRADRRRDRPDMGPLARRRRGQIEQEERADLDSTSEYKPSVTGARRADPLRAFLGIRNLHRPSDGATAENARRWSAAQTLRALVEIAGGAREGDRPLERVDTATSSSGYSDRLLDAVGAVRQASSAVGANYPVVRWVALEHSGLDEFAVVARLDVEEAERRLLAGLDALVEHLEEYQVLVVG